MTTSPQSRFGLLASAVTGFGLMVCGLLGGSDMVPSASAAQSRGAATEALQIVADIILIESKCRALNVDYGKLFAFAENNGISPVDIMPTGERRAAFDAAYQRRARELSSDRLCGEFAAERAATIPGVFTAR